MHPRSLLIVPAALTAWSAAAAQAPPVIAVRGATIHTAAGAPIRNGLIVVREGKIAAVGTGVPIPADARVYDVAGKEIIPGMMDSHSHIGDRLGVGGWSYGGILTNYVITKTTRFKGAISGASEALYTSNYGHDHYQYLWEIELGLPWRNREAWDRISPFWSVEKITTPTLWIGGERDWNVPIINSEQMYQAMRRLGRTTQLVVYPGQTHGISKPTYQKDRWQRYLEWYRKHVKGETS